MNKTFAVVRNHKVEFSVPEHFSDGTEIVVQWRSSRPDWIEVQESEWSDVPTSPEEWDRLIRTVQPMDWSSCPVPVSDK